MVIYHLADPADWARAQAEGEYRISTKGKTLEQEGFIHASDAGQVAGVANRYCDDDGDWVVLVIDTDRLASKVQYDDVPGSDAPYPHIYGPINVDAVTGMVPIEKGPDGSYHFDPPR